MIHNTISAIWHGACKGRDAPHESKRALIESQWEWFDVFFYL